ncbi:hypothetical protein K440DRAFT_159665 [Wilcoxina mikolae CBS 423.85]|nr:hypothetical protein K440DRAFT_159665 [Wilcoxina mikolae CBS 423.85]
MNPKFRVRSRVFTSNKKLLASKPNLSTCFHKSPISSLHPPPPPPPPLLPKPCLPPPAPAKSPAAPSSASPATPKAVQRHSAKTTTSFSRRASTRYRGGVRSDGGNTGNMEIEGCHVGVKRSHR